MAAPARMRGVLTKHQLGLVILASHPPQHQGQQERVDPVPAPKNPLVTCATFFVMVRPTPRQCPPIICRLSAPSRLLAMQPRTIPQVHRIVSLDLTPFDQAADARQRLDKLPMAIVLHARRPHRLQPGFPSALGHNASSHHQLRPQVVQLCTGVRVPSTSTRS